MANPYQGILYAGQALGEGLASLGKARADYGKVVEEDAAIQQSIGLAGQRLEKLIQGRLDTADSNREVAYRQYLTDNGLSDAPDIRGDWDRKNPIDPSVDQLGNELANPDSYLNQLAKKVSNSSSLGRGQRKQLHSELVTLLDRWKTEDKETLEADRWRMMYDLQKGQSERQERATTLAEQQAQQNQQAHELRLAQARMPAAISQSVLRHIQSNTGEQSKEYVDEMAKWRQFTERGDLSPDDFEAAQGLYNFMAKHNPQALSDKLADIRARELLGQPVSEGDALYQQLHLLGGGQPTPAALDKYLPNMSVPQGMVLSDKDKQLQEAALARLKHGGKPVFIDTDTLWKQRRLELLQQQADKRPPTDLATWRQRLDSAKRFVGQPPPPIKPMGVDELTRRATGDLRKDPRLGQFVNPAQVEAEAKRQLGVGPDIMGVDIPGAEGKKAIITGGKVLSVIDDTKGNEIKVEDIGSGMRLVTVAGKPWQMFPTAKPGESKEELDRRYKLFDAGIKNTEIKTYAGADLAFQELESLVNAQATSANAANDLAIVFKFMNVIEPGGIVREGEQEMIKRAGNIITGFKNMIDEAKEGTLMQQPQRLQLLGAARKMRDAKFAAAGRAWGLYAEQSREQGIDPKTVLPEEFHGILNSTGGGSGGAAGGGGQPRGSNFQQALDYANQGNIEDSRMKELIGNAAYNEAWGPAFKNKTWAEFLEAKIRQQNTGSSMPVIRINTGTGK